MKRTTKPKPAPRLYPRTPRQREILLYICDYIAGAGYSPTLDEIAERFGISKVTVFNHLEVLETYGLITKERYKARSIRLVLCEGKGVCPTCGRPLTEAACAS